MTPRRVRWPVEKRAEMQLIRRLNESQPPPASFAALALLTMLTFRFTVSKYESEREQRGREEQMFVSPRVMCATNQYVNPFTLK